MKKRKKAQVWVETVIYTLIGLTIMGALIAVITPRVNLMIDRAIVSQSMDSLNFINGQVLDSYDKGAGNQRAISLNVKKGEYLIDSASDSISFILENTGYMASQINEATPQGDLIKITRDRGNKKYDVSITLHYDNMNLTYQNKEMNRTFTTSSTSYDLIISYLGGSDKKINIESV